MIKNLGGVIYMQKSLVLALALAMGISATALAANPFSDVPAGHWAYGSITKLAAAGVVDGGPHLAVVAVHVHGHVAAAPGQAHLQLALAGAQLGRRQARRRCRRLTTAQPYDRLIDRCVAATEGINRGCPPPPTTPAR